LVAAILSTGDLDPALTVDQADQRWFHNHRSSGGLRLTAAGLQDFLKLGLNSWSFELGTTKMCSRDLIKLDKRLEFPYFIDRKKNRILFFGGKEAMMATLYNDARKWLENL
jgi:hypothetical protein